MLAVVSFLTACQKHDDTLQGTREDAWMYDVTLPVPIQFGSMNEGPATKADITSIEGLPLGVIAINNDESRDWTGKATAAVLPEDDYIWDGFVKEMKLKTENKVEKVVFEDGNTYYYPMNSSNSYDFYGYHPYSASVAVDYSPNGLYVPFSLDGKSEVLYAHAAGKSSFGVKGFNAAYVRAIQRAGAGAYISEFLPNLTFEHQLSKIKLQVVSGELEKDDSGNVKYYYDEYYKKPVENQEDVDVLNHYTKPIDCKNIRIVGAKIKKQYNSAKLCVVNGKQASLPGKFVVDSDNLVEQSLYDLYDDSAELEKVIPGATSKGIAYGFILPSNTTISGSSTNINSDAKGLELDVYYETSDDEGKTWTPADDPITRWLPRPENTETNYVGFESNTTYTYRLVVYDAQNIIVTVALSDRDDYNGAYTDGSGGKLNDDGTASSYVDFSRATVRFDYEGHLITDDNLAVLTNVPNTKWEISLPSDYGGWLTITPSAGNDNNEGKGKTPISIKAEENKSPNSREVELTVRLIGTDVSGKLKVIQEAATITAVKTLDFGSADVQEVETDLVANYGSPDFDVSISYNPGQWIDEAYVDAELVDATTYKYKLVVKAVGSNDTASAQTGEIVIKDNVHTSVKPIKITVRRDASSTGPGTEPSS